MKHFWKLTALLAGSALSLTLAPGCASSRSHARIDAYDGVKIDQLSGNKVSRGILDRRTLWLNARREIKRDQSKDYYLITELTPSPDFSQVSSGESLVLLVDGVRHGLSATNSQTTFIGRPGVLSTLYKISPDLLVQLANAQELKIRIKGSNNVIDEQAPPAVMANLRRWMLERFTPENSAPALSADAGSRVTAPLDSNTSTKGSK